MVKDNQEIDPRGEFFTAYSGTTLGNYQADAEVLEDGCVDFDKSRSSNHDFPETFFLEKPTGALEYAASVALETHDTPVVMEGRLPIAYRQRRALPIGVPFPVDTLWVPVEGVDRVEFLAQALFLGETREAFESMVPSNPRKSLRRDQ